MGYQVRGLCMPPLQSQAVAVNGKDEQGSGPSRKPCSNSITEVSEGKIRLAALWSKSGLSAVAAEISGTCSSSLVLPGVLQSPPVGASYTRHPDSLPVSCDGTAIPCILPRQLEAELYLCS